MTNIEPDGPYIYQPYGVQNRGHWDAKRIYGVSGLNILTTIKGLTRQEAEMVLKAIKPR